MLIRRGNRTLHAGKKRDRGGLRTNYDDTPLPAHLVCRPARKDVENNRGWSVFGVSQGGDGFLSFNAKTIMVKASQFFGLGLGVISAACSIRPGVPPLSHHKRFSCPPDRVLWPTADYKDAREALETIREELLHTFFKTPNTTVYLLAQSTVASHGGYVLKIEIFQDADKPPSPRESSLDPRKRTEAALRQAVIYGLLPDDIRDLSPLDIPEHLRDDAAAWLRRRRFRGISDDAYMSSMVSNLDSLLVSIFEEMRFIQAVEDVILGDMIEQDDDNVVRQHVK